MNHGWEQLEGVSLAGAYALEQWLGSDRTGAFFLTTSGRDGERAVAKLMVEDREGGGTRLEVWQQILPLRHPHLLTMLDCGRTEYESEALLYAIFEAPDDSLTAALQNGPLGEKDGGDVLAAAQDALQYLHAAGWVHGSIDAEHVVAVGDRIKLASDTLHRSTGPADEAEDRRALGALTYELITGRRVGPGDSADLSGISGPLATQLAEMLAARQTARAESTSAEPETESLPKPAPEPAVLPEPELPPRRPAVMVHEPFTRIPNPDPPEDAEPAAASTFGRYVPLAAIGLVALLAVIFVIAHYGSQNPQAVAITPPPVSAPEPSAPAAAPVIPASTPPSPLASWRVISYTFAREKDAEKKAEFINKKFSGIHAEVFPVGSSYLISLGAHMTREEAAVLRQKAIGKGLPRDTYIQNFTN